MPGSGIPGYTGFVPGKGCENVLGVTHGRANALAQAACIRRGDPLSQDFGHRPNPCGVAGPRRGAEIPGYTGYIPGKTASGVFGTTFADSNSVAMHARQDQALQRQKARPPSYYN